MIRARHIATALAMLMLTGCAGKVVTPEEERRIEECEKRALAEGKPLEPCEVER